MRVSPGSRTVSGAGGHTSPLPCPSLPRWRSPVHICRALDVNDIGTSQLEEGLSPEEGNELLGALAVVEVAGKVPGEEFLLDCDTPPIRSGEQTGDREDGGQTARCDSTTGPGQNRSQIPGMADKPVRT